MRSVGDFFIANLSHEIRTPVTAILGFSELLLEDGEYASGVRGRGSSDALQAICHNAHQLVRLIDDLLDLAALDAGCLNLECAPCPLREIVQGAIEHGSARASERSISFEARLDDHLPVCIQSDASRLSQILLNMVENAIRCTRIGGVRLEARHVDALPAGWLELSVQDAGVGMTADQLVSVLEPLGHPPDSAGRHGAGSAAGIALSRRPAELLGGSLTAESQLGQGSIFRLRLPAALPGSAD